MKVKITRNTVANKVAVFEGEVHDLPESEAKFLIALGKAIAIETEPQQPKIETADAQQPQVEQAIKPSVKK